MWQHELELILSDQVGLDLHVIGATQIERAVEARRSALGLGSAEEYIQKVAAIDRELAAFVEEIVVPESWFFRDRLPFARLQEFVRAGWFLNSDRASARLLSIPCASGEEAYSIAIALLELGLSSKRIQIDAVDISARLLERARRAVFTRHAFRGDPIADFSACFHEHAEGVELGTRVRDMVHFVQGNLLDPCLLADQPPYDVIFCRNLLIYFTEAARRRAIEALDRLLTADGLLFVGHAEGLSALEPFFIPDGSPGSFAFRRPEGRPAPKKALARQSNAGESQRSAEPPAEATRPSAGSERVSEKGTGPVQPRRKSLIPGAGRRVLSPFQTRSEHVARVGTPGLELPPPRGAPEVVEGSLLDRAHEMTNQRRYQEAVELCQDALRTDGPSAVAYFLLGMIHSSTGQAAEAEASLLKVVYLEHSHEEALLALALLAEHRGEVQTAQRYRQRAGRAHVRQGTP